MPSHHAIIESPYLTSTSSMRTPPPNFRAKLAAVIAALKALSVSKLELAIANKPSIRQLEYMLSFTPISRRPAPPAGSVGWIAPRSLDNTVPPWEYSFEPQPEPGMSPQRRWPRPLEKELAATTIALLHDCDFEHGFPPWVHFPFFANLMANLERCTVPELVNIYRAKSEGLPVHIEHANLDRQVASCWERFIDAGAYGADQEEPLIAKADIPMRKIDGALMFKYNVFR
ncbi:hypothetical protein C8F04DRAFT_1353135 [Mycena alexandri]|uniref:Uncharacterized protein n=1 Tax=Mycena alexandri TaxID=1745969 RepID=A0AAD6STC6_9AGAR|nr:hypothetical protein C8F04DRAFT_1353135 [Mycena alexandri]